jgi:CRP/FNR family cyclic AMP-dependent transcriptional regulator
MRTRVAQREIEMLRQVPLFSSCSQSELRQIAGLGTPVPIAAGRRLTVEGQPGREFFLVLEGRARCEVGGRHAADFVPGDFFGELALLDGGPRSATVVAETDMEVLVLDAREFASLLQAAPSILRKVLATLAGRLRLANAARAD